MKDVSFPEIAELKEQIRKLKIENEQLKRFVEIGKCIGVERDIDHLLPLVMTEISKFLNADRSTLFLIDWERMELWTKFAEDLEVERISIKLKMGLVGLCVLKKQIINVANAYEDPRFNPYVDEITGYKTESLLSAPLFGKDGEVMGAVQLLNKKTGLFTKDDEQNVLKYAEILASMDFASNPGKDKVRASLFELRHSTQCERGTIFLLEREKGMLFPVVSEGLEDKNICLSLNLGIAGLVAITGKNLDIRDAYADPRFDKRTDERTGYRTRCILCVPIKNQSGEILGVIEVINKKNGTFSDFDMDLLKALSSIVAISLENAILFQDQHRQFRSILKVMAASIDAKDSLTAGHSEKVDKYAVGIARELGFGETDIDILSVAALLHDYGKLGVDDEILKKPGKLTQEEYDHIKQHVVITRNILEKMYFTRKYRNVPLIASTHHERLDGSGYIDGLKAQDIPFMSKIIIAADVFEALTAKRHYRDALSPEDAFEILERDAGTKFDVNIVAALKKYWYKHQTRNCNSLNS